MLCRDCGYVPQCPHCDISLTYHKTTDQLKCHYCGYQENPPSQCPNCEGDHIRQVGTGTQRVEELLQQEFEEAKIIRMDVDTTSKKGAHEKLLTAFGNQEANILLGTQMIAKGLDFPNITLVGVLNADTMLNLPDFRASERTYQLLTQVAGRAGRHGGFRATDPVDHPRGSRSRDRTGEVRVVEASCNGGCRDPSIREVPKAGLGSRQGGRRASLRSPLPPDRTEGQEKEKWRPGLLRWRRRPVRTGRGCPILPSTGQLAG